MRHKQVKNGDITHDREIIEITDALVIQKREEERKRHRECGGCNKKSEEAEE